VKSLLAPSLLSALWVSALGCDSGRVQIADPASLPATQVVPTVPDYGLALRSASLRLLGTLPTLSEIKQLQTENDQRSFLHQRVEAYVQDPRFVFAQREFFRNTFRTGGTPMTDTAPTFAAAVVAQDRPFTDVLLAQSGTCPQLQEDGSVRSADCKNGIPAVGVLTDPGLQAQLYSSMAFRRVRWVQETFLCRKFPAENGGRREEHPSGTYFSPWEFTSISGLRTDRSARIDFHADDKGELCANCHSTMNHIAPLLAGFDQNGQFIGMKDGAYPVLTPVPGSPPTRRQDFLPDSEPTAWRFGQPTADLQALGQAIAADEDMAKCMATRVWNWALSRGDAVSDEATLPPELASQLARDFKRSGYSVKRLIRQIFATDAFIRY